jgi:murein DD-endopeptidase MepM/ murein hydrolase activator NlpD
MRSFTDDVRGTLHAQQAPRFDPDLVHLPPATDGIDTLPPLEVVLQRGQTLSSLLAQLGLPGDASLRAVDALAAHLEVRKLRPGLVVTGFFRDSPHPSEIEVVVAGRGRLRLSAVDTAWESDWRPFEERIELRRLEGAIEGSLVRTLGKLGAPAEVAYAMADVLRWDVDFTRDLQPGDRFRVLYEQVLLDGADHRTGAILAAELWNRGRLLEAYRFDEGYYDGEGRPLRKMFLRAPLTFNRISSGFTHRRFHPVLQRYSPHYGVDYAAPVGTPVHSTADGVVTFVGWDRGGGNTVKIRHPNEYLSAYLHLSRFAKGMQRGSRVRQGEVIGYVGATGLATGPHLDYRVQHRGRWIDPLSIKSVPAEPIARSELPAFVAWRDRLREGLADGLLEPAMEPDYQLARFGGPAGGAMLAAGAR